jgi:hypothetical protein
MKNGLMTSLLVLTMASIFGCSSTTVIHSSDPDSKIYVDGELMGRGTVTHTDTKIVGSSTQVMIKKDGCEPQTFVFSRSEEFSVGPCIGGVFLLVPFLWVEGYRPQHNYEFECERRAGSASVEPVARIKKVKSEE